jgi:glycosyltransferase involved in cell wall biosynthesis
MISVIIPNYNHARFLNQRIDSVLNQSFSDFEVIILDDCSTDNSRDIIESYRNHPKVKQVIYNDMNSGSTFQQWQRGIECAKGEWIWIAESDDFSQPDLLMQLIANTAVQEKIVIAYCQSNEVDENNTLLGTMHSWTNDIDSERWMKGYVNDGRSEIMNYLALKNTIPNASAVLFRRSAYLKLDKDHASMKYCGDWLLWIKLLEIGDIVYNAQLLNFFRNHGSTTRVMDSKARLRNRLEEEYAILKYIQQNIGISRQVFRKRLKRIVGLYSYFLTKKEIAKFSLVPFSYKGKLPFHKVLIEYLWIKFNIFFSRKQNFNTASM